MLTICIDERSDESTFKLENISAEAQMFNKNIKLTRCLQLLAAGLKWSLFCNTLQYCLASVKEYKAPKGI